MDNESHFICLYVALIAGIQYFKKEIEAAGISSNDWWIGSLLPRKKIEVLTFLLLALKKLDSQLKDKIKIKIFKVLRVKDLPWFCRMMLITLFTYGHKNHKLF